MKTLFWGSGVLLMVALIAGVGCVSIQRISSSHLIASAANYELRIRNTTISMHTRRKASGIIRENDYIEYSFLAWSDDIIWSLSPNNGTGECSRTTTLPQNFTGPSTLTVEPGPGGTTLASTTVPFGENCNLSAIFYVSDVDTFIVIDGYNNTISADEAKLSIRLSCPWRSHLAKYANVSEETPAWGRGRALTVYSYFNVISSTGFNDFPRSNFSERLKGFPDFAEAAINVCARVDMTSLNTREYPTPSLWPNYDFSRESLLFFNTPESRTTIGFLTWAIADHVRRVRVSSNYAEDRPISVNGLGFIYWPVDIRLEGYNTVDYDPSLSQIFYEDEQFIASNSQNAPGINGTNLNQGDGLPVGAAAGIAVAVIAPLAIAGAATWLLLRRKREHRSHAQVVSRLENARLASTEQPGPRNSSDNSPAPQESGGWAKATKTKDLSNVRASKL